MAEYSTQITQTPQVSYLTQDHLGSPRVITDSVGNILARKDFSAFGDETATAQRTTALGYKPENIRQDYTGYQKDDESGLEYAQARYYNSAHGRYTSIDPLTASANIKDPQTFNRYSYAMNSPYKFTDPLGLISSSTGACGQWCPNSDGGGGGYSSEYSRGKQQTEGAGLIAQTADDPPPPPSPPGVVSAGDITSTVKLPTEYDGVLEDGTKVTYMLPKETQSALQSAAEISEQTNLAQSQNANAAVSQLRSEFAHGYMYKNPKMYSLFGVPDVDFNSSNGTIIPVSIPDVGFNITVGPVTPTNSGLDTSYSEGALNLVKAANSQLQEIRQMENFQKAENFAATEIKTRSQNDSLPVTFKVKGSSEVKNGSISKATLISHYNRAIDVGRSQAVTRIGSVSR